MKEAWQAVRAKIQVERSGEGDVVAMLEHDGRSYMTHAETPDLAAERLRCKFLGLKCRYTARPVLRLCRKCNERDAMMPVTDKARIGGTPLCRSCSAILDDWQKRFADWKQRRARNKRKQLRRRR